MADQPPQSPSARTELPEGAFDRAIEALIRSRSYLLPAAQQQLADLWDLDTLFALAALLLVWGGFQLFTPIGWVADIALAIAGGVTFGRDLYKLGAAIAKAVEAQTDQELDDSAKAIADGITTIGIDTVLLVLGNATFKGIRTRLSKYRGTYSKKTGIVSQRLSQITATTGGAGGGLVTGTPEFREVGSGVRSLLNIGLPLAGGAVLVYGLYRLTRRTK